MGERLGGRIDALDERTDAMGERLGVRIDAMGERTDAMGERLGGRIDAMGERLGGRIDALTEEVSTTRRELLAAISHHEHDTDGSVRFRVPPPA